MADSKPLASLSSGLLARKGHASPAMRRQGMLSMVTAHPAETFGGPGPEMLEDLGWNDMGDLHDHVPGINQAGLSPMGPSPAGPAPAASAAHIPITAPEPVDYVPEVVRQQHELARELAAPQRPVPVRESKPRAAPGSKGKAAFTLRLDAERHLKLRLVCAVDHRSAQQVVTQALDEFLARQPIAKDVASVSPSARSAN